MVRHEPHQSSWGRIKGARAICTLGPAQTNHRSKAYPASPVCDINQFADVVVGDAVWSELLRQLTYKASWNGRTFCQSPHRLASSKTCSDYGFKLEGAGAGHA